MKTYRQLEDELQLVLQRVENAQYDELDNLLKDYELGMKLLKDLEKKLQTVKNTIKKSKKERL